MPIGFIDRPKTPHSTATNSKSELELVLMGQTSAFIGKLVRVTVYDQVLFQHGDLKGQFLETFSRFNGTDPNQVVPDNLRFPAPLITDGSNGILVSLLLPVVKELATGTRGAVWAFGNPTELKEASPKQVAVTFDFITRDVNSDRQTRATIRMPFSRLNAKRPLIIVVERPDTHGILFSSGYTVIKGKPSPLAKNNTRGGPTVVNMGAIDAGLPPEIGNTGLGTGAPDIHAAPPPTDDVTGIYEVFTESSHNLGDNVPVMFMQLNQAGNSVAGWINPIIPDITGEPQLRLPAPPDLSPLKNNGFSVLLAHMDGDDIPFNWGQAGSTDDPEPKFVKEGTGELTVLGNGRIEIIFFKDGGKRVLFGRFREPVPRWSHATIQGVIDHDASGSSLLKRIFRAQQVEPIPIAFWDLLEQDFDANGKLGKLITADENASIGIAKTQTRKDISDYLLSLIKRLEYQEVIVAHFVTLAAGTDLTINGKTQRVYTWLDDIVKDQLGNVLKTAGGLVDPSQAINLVNQGFQDFGFAPPNVFVYQFEFFPVGAEIPTAIKVGVYAFEVQVKRFTVGSDGKLGPQDFANGWTLIGKKMFGGFGDIGIALEIPFKLNNTSSILMKAEFASFHDLSPADINCAEFYSISAGGPALSFGPLRIISLGSSAVMVMTVKKTGFDGAIKDTVRMVTGIDSLPRAGGVNPQILKNPAGTKLKIRGASLSMGWGWMTETKPGPLRKPDGASTEAREILGKVRRDISVFFRRGGSNLVGTNLAAFEETLAVERSIFVSGGGFVTAIGNCSPEGSDNAGLALRRAEATMEAVKNAFGKNFELEAETFGQSDDLAIQAGVFPPPGPGAPQSDKDKYVRQEKFDYPKFRFVQLNVEGTVFFTIEVHKAGASDGVEPQNPGS